MERSASTWEFKCLHFLQTFPKIHKIDLGCWEVACNQDKHPPEISSNYQMTMIAESMIGIDSLVMIDLTSEGGGNVNY